ncbi:hypothetical protein [Nitrosospira briensis]|uniref:hypothetical protein n=1 Tax=Nitrosospira briensis TaxID=35799 RepID=UPI0008E5129E|nr:hypothetical protein [Nitrosospira briensis]SFO42675.1 hypothetical protein SAMN05216332_11630 [Nitrosospira briensis]
MIHSEENILRLVGGEYIAAALKALPDSNTATEDFQESVIEVPNLGKVRFTCRRVKSKHHKSVNVFWSAIAAVKIG